MAHCQIKLSNSGSRRKPCDWQKEHTQLAKKKKKNNQHSGRKDSLVFDFRTPDHCYETLDYRCTCQKEDPEELEERASVSVARDNNENLSCTERFTLKLGLHRTPLQWSWPAASETAMATNSPAKFSALMRQWLHMDATASDTAVRPVKNCRPRYFACHFGTCVLVDVAAPDDCQVLQCGTASRAETKPPLHARHHSNVSLTENISCVIAYVLVTRYSNLGTSPQFVKQTCCNATIGTTANRQHRFLAHEQKHPQSPRNSKLRS
jgi:hypothetical protein